MHLRQLLLGNEIRNNINGLNWWIGPIRIKEDSWPIASHPSLLLLLAVAREFFVKTKEFFLGSSHQIRTRYVFNMQTYAKKFEETFSGEPKKNTTALWEVYILTKISITTKNVKRQRLFLEGILFCRNTEQCFVLASRLQRESKILQASPWGKETKLLQSCKSKAVCSTSLVLFTYLAY